MNQMVNYYLISVFQRCLQKHTHSDKQVQTQALPCLSLKTIMKMFVLLQKQA